MRRGAGFFGFLALTELLLAVVGAYSGIRQWRGAAAVTMSIDDDQTVLVGQAAVDARRKDIVVRRVSFVLGCLLLSLLFFTKMRMIRRHNSRLAAGCCVKCGYNLTGNTSGVCSECGAPFVYSQGKPSP